MSEVTSVVSAVWSWAPEVAPNCTSGNLVAVWDGNHDVQSVRGWERHGTLRYKTDCHRGLKLFCDSSGTFANVLKFYQCEMNCLWLACLKVILFIQVFTELMSVDINLQGIYIRGQCLKVTFQEMELESLLFTQCRLKYDTSWGKRNR